MSFSQQAVLRRYSSLGGDPRVAEYYRGSGFLNFGLWQEGEADVVAACQRLVDELVLRLGRQGRVLEVACGNGATTRRLLGSWQPDQVAAIDLCDVHLEAARRRAPGCEFHRMDGTKLTFNDEAFEDVLCVEAAFHFNTRQQFLREALRVLKPGGRIALSDLLMPRWAWRASRRVPTANCVTGAEEYRRLIEAAGFQDVEIRDVTGRSVRPFFAHFWEYGVNLSNEGRLRFGQMLALKIFWEIQQRAFRGYLLVSARK